MDQASVQEDQQEEEDREYGDDSLDIAALAARTTILSSTSPTIRAPPRERKCPFGIGSNSQSLARSIPETEETA
jgi:hypothetical protein